MGRMQSLGEGHLPSIGPCGVAVALDDPERPLYLDEGYGHGGCGGTFALQAIRDPSWHAHLTACRCEWLIDLAEEEEANGTQFTPHQIVLAGRRNKARYDPRN